MEDLGKYLKALRESSGFTYQKVWQDTKISEQNLRAIEANDLFALGNYGYCKALVYNYARYLGADVDAVMKEFSVLMPESTKRAFVPKETIKEKKILLSTNFLWLIAIIIIVTILGAILYRAYLGGYLKPPSLFEEKKPKPEKTEETPEPAAPDSLRKKMLKLTENMNTDKKETPKKKANKKENPYLKDNTDYVGQELGESPLNVPTD